MAVQINGQDLGPIKFTDDRSGKIMHIGVTAPINPVDGDVWMDGDPFNNAGKNLIQVINLSTGGTTKSCTVSADYKDLEIIIKGLNVSLNSSLFVRLNGDATASYSTANNTITNSLFEIDVIKPSINNAFVKINVIDPSNPTTYKIAFLTASYVSNTTNLPKLTSVVSSYLPTTPITSVTLTLSAGAFVDGTVLVYGVN